MQPPRTPSNKARRLKPTCSEDVDFLMQKVSHENSQSDNPRPVGKWGLIKSVLSVGKGMNRLGSHSADSGGNASRGSHLNLQSFVTAGLFNSGSDDTSPTPSDADGDSVSVSLDPRPATTLPHPPNYGSTSATRQTPAVPIDLDRVTSM